MTLKDGFYLYIVSNVCDGTKYQTVKMMFDCRNNIVREPYFEEDGVSLVGFAKEEYNILDRSEEELMAHLDSYNNNGFCFCGPIETQKKELVLVEQAYAWSPIYRPLFNLDFFDGELCDCIKNDLCDRRLCKDTPIKTYSLYIDFLNQFEILVAELEKIFLTVAPDKRNLSVFGHALRNLLILACTEVDCLLRDVYISTKGRKSKDCYSTKDYVSLLQLLRLNEYEITLCRYPSLGDYSPFANWNIEKPTESLAWYDAYNAVKHDRENSFDRATLDNCINAVLAVAILLAAKFGYRNDVWNENLGKKIRYSCEPGWSIFDFRILENNTNMTK